MARRLETLVPVSITVVVDSETGELLDWLPTCREELERALAQLGHEMVADGSTDPWLQELAIRYLLNCTPTPEA